MFHVYIQVFEGYGQTEGTAGATLSLPGDFSVGHVGAPLACNFIKLVDVPEMDYYAKNNEGEVSKSLSLSLLWVYINNRRLLYSMAGSSCQFLQLLSLAKFLSHFILYTYMYM